MANVKVETKLSDYTANSLDKLSISDIAEIINKDWRKMGGVNYAAKPYLDAMYSLEKISDKYINESGKSIVLYFLSNASTWKGEVAREVKKHLNKLCK